MSIFSSFKNKYTVCKNQDSQAKEEVAKGLEVLSVKDKSFNYKKWIMSFCILFLIAWLFIYEAPYTTYSSAFIEIGKTLNLFVLVIPLLVILRLLRVIGKMQPQTVNHED